MSYALQFRKILKLSDASKFYEILKAAIFQNTERANLNLKAEAQSISATTARPCGENLNLKARSKPKFKTLKLVQRLKARPFR
nr:hypothetical protein [uncultured Campylobacter sp.]